jgi:hypothetical protein
MHQFTARAAHTVFSTAATVITVRQYRPEQIGSTELYVCGDGYATQSGSTLSGVMAGAAILVDGNRRVACGGSHRFTFLPEAR